MRGRSLVEAECLRGEYGAIGLSLLQMLGGVSPTSPAAPSLSKYLAKEKEAEADWWPDDKTFQSNWCMAEVSAKSHDRTARRLAYEAWETLLSFNVCNGLWVF